MLLTGLSKRRFFKMFDTMVAPLFINCVKPGKEGIVYANKALLQAMRARSPSDLVGKHVSVMFSEEQPGGRTLLDLVKEVETSVQEKGSWRGHAGYKRMDGTTFATYGTTIAAMVNNTPYILVTLEDPTSMLRFLDNFQSSVGTASQTVLEMVGEVSGSTQSMVSMIEQAAEQARHTATVTQQSAGNIGEISEAVERISIAISNITNQMRSASTITQSAVEQSQKTDTLVQGMDQAAKNIGQVIGVIKSIADKTTLLALNASIEAARAGEAGRGFGVVAEEVKNLANQTAQATDEISRQIGSVQASITETVGAIRGTSEVIGQINQISESVASAIQEQSIATHNIASNVDEAAKGASSASQSVNAIDQATTAARDAAASASQAMLHLAKQAEQLKVQVNSFVRELHVGF